jgi:hypothetical protein
MVFTLDCPERAYGMNGYAWGTLETIARADGKPVPLAPWEVGPNRREHHRRVFS